MSDVLTHKDVVECVKKLEAESNKPSYWYCRYCGANQSMNEPHKKLVGSNFKEYECPTGALEKMLQEELGD